MISGKFGEIGELIFEIDLIAGDGEIFPVQVLALEKLDCLIIILVNLIYLFNPNPLGFLGLRVLRVLIGILSRLRCGMDSCLVLQT